MARMRIQDRRGFWVLLCIGVIAVGVLGGLYLADEQPGGILVTTYGTPRKARSYTDPDMPADVKKEWEALRSSGLKRVSKFIEAGIIQRINEAKRQLFVNDPVWRAMSQDRQEHVARVVTGYLDVVNEGDPGTVGVFSFRNGSLIAEINHTGTYVIYR